MHHWKCVLFILFFSSFVPLLLQQTTWLAKKSKNPQNKTFHFQILNLKSNEFGNNECSSVTHRLISHRCHCYVFVVIAIYYPPPPHTLFEYHCCFYHFFASLIFYFVCLSVTDCQRMTQKRWVFHHTLQYILDNFVNKSSISSAQKYFVPSSPLKS